MNPRKRCCTLHSPRQSSDNSPRDVSLRGKLANIILRSPSRKGNRGESAREAVAERSLVGAADIKSSDHDSRGRIESLDEKAIGRLLRLPRHADRNEIDARSRRSDKFLHSVVRAISIVRTKSQARRTRRSLASYSLFKIERVRVHRERRVPSAASSRTGKNVKRGKTVFIWKKEEIIRANEHLEIPSLSRAFIHGFLQLSTRSLEARCVSNTREEKGDAAN